MSPDEIKAELDKALHVLATGDHPYHAPIVTAYATALQATIEYERNSLILGRTTFNNPTRPAIPPGSQRSV